MVGLQAGEGEPRHGWRCASSSLSAAAASFTPQRSWPMLTSMKTPSRLPSSAAACARMSTCEGSSTQTLKRPCRAIAARRRALAVPTTSLLMWMSVMPACEKGQRLARLLAADATGAARDLRQGDRRALVRLGMRPQCDAGGSGSALHPRQVAIEGIEVQQQRGRVHRSQRVARSGRKRPAEIGEPGWIGGEIRRHGRSMDSASAIRRPRCNAAIWTARQAKKNRSAAQGRAPAAGPDPAASGRRCRAATSGGRNGVAERTGSRDHRRPGVLVGGVAGAPGRAGRFDPECRRRVLFCLGRLARSIALLAWHIPRRRDGGRRSAACFGGGATRRLGGVDAEGIQNAAFRRWDGVRAAHRPAPASSSRLRLRRRRRQPPVARRGTASWLVAGPVLASRRHAIRAEDDRARQRDQQGPACGADARASSHAVPLRDRRVPRHGRRAFRSPRPVLPQAGRPGSIRREDRACCRRRSEASVRPRTCRHTRGNSAPGPGSAYGRSCNIWSWGFDVSRPWSACLTRFVPPAEGPVL